MVWNDSRESVHVCCDYTTVLISSFFRNTWREILSISLLSLCLSPLHQDYCSLFLRSLFYFLSALCSCLPAFWVTDAVMVSLFWGGGIKCAISLQQWSYSCSCQKMLLSLNYPLLPDLYVSIHPSIIPLSFFYFLIRLSKPVFQSIHLSFCTEPASFCLIRCLILSIILIVFPLTSCPNPSIILYLCPCQLYCICHYLSIIKTT